MSSSPAATPALPANPEPSRSFAEAVGWGLGKFVRKWWGLIAIGIGLILIAYVSDRTPTFKPMPSRTPAIEGPVAATSSQEGTSSSEPATATGESPMAPRGSQATKATAAPARASAATAQGATSRPPSNPFPEVKPAVGAGRSLSMDEVRYCAFEDERLSRMKDLVTGNDQVRIFNAFVSDYNSRCGSFRYRRGTLETAQRQAKERGWELQKEAAARLSPGAVTP